MLNVELQATFAIEKVLCLHNMFHGKVNQANVGSRHMESALYIDYACEAFPHSKMKPYLT